VIAPFGDLITLRKIVFPATAEPGQDVHIQLWWFTADVPPVDYTVSVFYWMNRMCSAPNTTVSRQRCGSDHKLEAG